MTAPFNGTTQPVTAFSYDVSGNALTESIKPSVDTTLVTAFGYDDAGRQVSVTTPSGTCSGCVAANHTTRTAYFADGMVKSRTDQLGRVTRYAYAGNGQTLAVSDPKGRVRSFSYDADARLAAATQLQSVGTATATTGYRHDAVGDLESVVTARGGNMLSEQVVERDLTGTEVLLVSRTFGLRLDEGSYLRR